MEVVKFVCLFVFCIPQVGSYSTCIGLSWANPKEADHLEELGVDGKVT